MFSCVGKGYVIIQKCLYICCCTVVVSIFVSIVWWQRSDFLPSFSVSMLDEVLTCRILDG